MKKAVFFFKAFTMPMCIRFLVRVTGNIPDIYGTMEFCPGTWYETFGTIPQLLVMIIY